MERRIFIVLGLGEEHLSLRLIRIGLLKEEEKEVRLHLIIASHAEMDAKMEVAVAIARHTEVPLLGFRIGRMSTFTHEDLELREFLPQNRDKEMDKINEIFLLSKSSLQDYSKELEDIIKKEYFPFFHDKKEVNKWKWREISQTKFNRHIKRLKWQTCRSQL